MQTDESIRAAEINGFRRENSAEHSWQMALSGFILAEYSKAPIDVFRAVKMLALHDVAEIDVGDTLAGKNRCQK